MKRVILVVSALALTACAKEPMPIAPRASTMEQPAKKSGARLGAGDFADAGTTVVGLSMGFAEANPLLASAGPAAPLAALGVKYGLKYGLIKAGGNPDFVNRRVEAIGMLAACANIATISGAAAPPAILLGVGCGVAYDRQVKRIQDARIRDEGRDSAELLRPSRNRLSF